MKDSLAQDNDEDDGVRKVIQDGIDKLKREGIVISQATFYQILAAVNKTNIIDINLHPVRLNFHQTLVLLLNLPLFNYLYALFIFVSIFSYTSLLDNSSYSWIAEVCRLVLGLSIIYAQGYSWYNLNGLSIYAVLLIIVGSFLWFLYFQNDIKRRIPNLSIS